MAFKILHNSVTTIPSVSSPTTKLCVLLCLYKCHLFPLFTMSFFYRSTYWFSLHPSRLSSNMTGSPIIFKHSKLELIILIFVLPEPLSVSVTWPCDSSTCLIAPNGRELVLFLNPTSTFINDGSYGLAHSRQLHYCLCNLYFRDSYLNIGYSRIQKKKVCRKCPSYYIMKSAVCTRKLLWHRQILHFWLSICYK